MRGTRGWAAVVLTALCGTGAAACGGGERQDADEPEGSWRLEVTRASFPAEQSIAERSRLEIVVRNADDRPAPNVAVTLGTRSQARTGAVQAFSADIERTDVSDRSRPVWIVDRSPQGADTAYTDTWALGPMDAGETRRFVWQVTAVRSGTYTVEYAVSPGLTGKARPADGSGRGSFAVDVSDEPPDARVTASGKVVRDLDRD